MVRHYRRKNLLGRILSLKKLLNSRLLSFVRKSLELLHSPNLNNAYIWVQFSALVSDHKYLDRMSSSWSILLWPILGGKELFLIQICNDHLYNCRLETEFLLHSRFKEGLSTWNLLDHQGTKAIQLERLKLRSCTCLLSNLFPNKVVWQLVQSSLLKEFHWLYQVSCSLPLDLCIHLCLLLWGSYLA